MRKHVLSILGTLTNIANLLLLLLLSVDIVRAQFSEMGAAPLFSPHPTVKKSLILTLRG